MARRGNNQRGQSVFEYFILSILVVSIALIFLNNQHYIRLQGVADDVFNQAVLNITK